jgi:TPR repeat protein
MQVYQVAILAKENQIEEAKKYYLMAIDGGNYNSMNNYAILLKKENQIDEAKKYYLMAIDKGSASAIHNYCNIEIDYIRKYYQLSKLTSKIAQDKVKELLKNKEVFAFYRRSTMLNKQDNCMICYEHSNLVPKECLHYYCLNCYFKIDICAICKH